MHPVNTRVSPEQQIQNGQWCLGMIHSNNYTLFFFNIIVPTRDRRIHHLYIWTWYSYWGLKFTTMIIKRFTAKCFTINNICYCPTNREKRFWIIHSSLVCCFFFKRNSRRKNENELNWPMPPFWGPKMFMTSAWRELLIYQFLFWSFGLLILYRSDIYCNSSDESLLIVHMVNSA